MCGVKIGQEPLNSTGGNKLKPVTSVFSNQGRLPNGGGFSL